MDHNRIAFQPLADPGEVTTFYAYEGGAARNAALAALDVFRLHRSAEAFLITAHVF